MDGTIVKKDSFQVSWKKLILIKLVAVKENIISKVSNSCNTLERILKFKT